MKKVFFSFGIVCISLLLASCSSTKKALSPASLNGEWNIVQVDGKSITSNTQQHMPFIGLDYGQKRVYGNSGCNRMMGTFNVDSVNPGMISFGQMAGTRMACPDMTTEQSVLAALNQVKSYELLSGENQNMKLALKDVNGKKIMEIEKRDPQSTTNDLSQLGGEWSFVTVNGQALEATDKTPFLNFDIEEMRVNGTAGCNSMNGMIKQEEGQNKSLKLGPIATTMMACANMDVERKVLDALNEVASYNMMANGNLALLNSNGTEIIVLQKK